MFFMFWKSFYGRIFYFWKWEWLFLNSENFPAAFLTESFLFQDVLVFGRAM